MARLLSDRLVTGGLIILVGVLLLLSTTDAFPTEDLWDFFPLVFVLLGVWALVRSRFLNLTGPVMVIAVAGTFQLRNLGYVTDQRIGTWWPLFVVLFGVLFIVARSRRSRRSTSISEEDAGEVTLVSLFSGTQRSVVGPGFRGGDVVVLFGGAELDLRDADAPTDTASMECLVLFGGAEIHVPDDWTVDLDVLSVFGAAEDERPRGERSPDTDLVVTGLAMFGGVSVSR